MGAAVPVGADVVTASLPGLVPPEPSLAELVAQAREIVAGAKVEHQPSATFILFSGGNDSLVLLDVLADEADVVFHVETGIGIPDTDVFAEAVGSSYGLPYIVEQPPVSYDDLVLGVWGGMPGPGAHRYTYIRLKERCVEQLLRQHRSRNGERFLLLTGARRAESRRRMGHTTAVRRIGGQVWVNPLFHWSNEAMGEYRSTRNLPVNPVSANLHMSGECLCGAMADQDHHREERAAIKFFYPEFDRRLCDLERQCRERGLAYAEWGVKRPAVKAEVDGQEAFDFSPMCASCEYRYEEGAA